MSDPIYSVSSRPVSTGYATSEIVAPESAKGTLGEHSVGVGKPDKSLAIDIGSPSGPKGSHALRPNAVHAPPVDARARTLGHEALPSGAQLKSLIGREPHADRLCGAWKMSTHYKDVLVKLDSFNEGLATARGTNADPMAAPHEKPLSQVNDLLLRCQKLEQSLIEYGAARRTGHKPEMESLLGGVQMEKAQLLRMQHDLSTGMPWPPGLDLKDALDQLRASPDMSLTQAKQCHDLGIAPKQVGMMTHQGFPLTASGLTAYTLSRPGVDPGLSVASAKFAIAQGMSSEMMRAYATAHMPINPTTLANAAPSGELTALGSGQMATVFKGAFTLADGTVATGVFKAENPDAVSDVAEKELGIDAKAPGWAQRSVATSRLDEKLGLGLVPHTELAVVDGKIGSVMGLAQGKSPLIQGDFQIPLAPKFAALLRDTPGALDDLVKLHKWQGAEVKGDTLQVKNTGVMVVEVDDEGRPTVTAPKPYDTQVTYDMSSATLRRDLTKLQWLDALTGQVDRNAHNYFVYKGTDGKPHVSAIDNDLAFGAKTTHGNMICGAFINAQKFGIPLHQANMGATHGAMLPNVIDRATRDALMTLSDADLEHELKGLITPDELAACKSRLVSIKEKIAELDRNGGVIDKDEEWGSAETGKRLGVMSLAEMKQVIDDGGSPIFTKGTRPDHMERGMEKLVGVSSYVSRETFAIESVMVKKDAPYISAEMVL
jgi:hypothetical protein